MAETSFVWGLVVPSGLATSAATVLALQGAMSLESVALAAAAGGWCGDSLGYWIGRLGRRRLEGSTTRWGRWLRGERGRGSRFLGRHPVYSVTVARLVSFVRTLMPAAAGMNGLGYPGFLAFEAPGLAGWVAMYMGIGLLAGESWRAASRIVGVGWTVVFVVAGLVLWRARRRRRGVGDAGPAAPVSDTDPDPAASPGGGG